ncbi:MAG: TonB-dependent receptor [Bacteroidales bacterium]|nr:TonB-dependent receptor [Bacteroidales bacterium]
MKKFLVLLPFLLFLTSETMWGQSINQVVKGIVIEKETHIPLPGVNVFIIGSDPVLGAVTEEDGRFLIPTVPIGRHDIRFSFIGFDPLVLNEILVGTGKELFLHVELAESVLALSEVLISAQISKDQPINKMATLSARQLSVEEANRYAGGFDDPSRLASSFAGVAQNLGNNGIVIRGNSPKGLLWRMEGIQISNPTHFANYVAIGAGAITALSSQVLANSDFYTGAFPAEYANALSGVVDLKMRTGNPDKREFTLQVGVIGLDAAAEGPFVKGKPSTYLFNYRYSTLALLTPILPKEAGVLRYQDLSFKLNFPTRKAGTFSVWGLGALDHQGKDAIQDITQWETNEDRKELQADLFMGVTGISHKYLFGRKSFLNTTLALSGNGMQWYQKRLDSSLVMLPKEDVKVYNYALSLTSSLNHKFGPKHTNRTGITLNQLFYDVDIKNGETYQDSLIQVANDAGNITLLQVFSQSMFNPWPGWTFNAGLTMQFFTLNGHYTIEPRVGIRWDFHPRHSLGVAYGLHAQLELISFYLMEIQSGDDVVKPNQNLDFSKSHHFVLAYDFRINNYFRFKAEPFFQYLFNIPVIPGTPWSAQNISTEWMITDTLVNQGNGTNFGIDLTLEKFMHRGYYFLVTGSFFNSRYKGGDEVWRNTRFNRQYVVNLLGGKEWLLGRRKSTLLSINGKFTLMGGEWHTPILYDESMATEKIIYDESRAFEEQEPMAKVLSLNLSCRFNRPKISHTITLSVLNALGQAEFDGYHYDPQNKTITPREDALVIPNISYKIEF